MDSTIYANRFVQLYVGSRVGGYDFDFDHRSNYHTFIDKSKLAKRVCVMECSELVGGLSESC